VNIHRLYFASPVFSVSGNEYVGWVFTSISIELMEITEEQTKYMNWVKPSDGNYILIGKRPDNVTLVPIDV
jgi:hypothetical protein